MRTFAPASATDNWHALPTHTLRFAEVLAKVTQSRFRVAELLYLFTAVDDPDVYLYENFKCGTARNYSDYCDEHTDKMIDAQSQELDRAKRMKLVGEIQKKLEAEQSKFEVGMSTNYFVVQAQRDLNDARNSELRQILNYRKSLVEFERLQQTTLQNLNVTVLNAGGGAGNAAATSATTNRAGGGQ